MSQAPSLVWFRRDLRLADNPALSAAAARGRPIVALFVLDDETPGHWAYGGASRWWLHHSLDSLRQALDKHGLQLALRRGRADQVLRRLARQCGADAVYWNRCYEPFAVERDTRLKEALRSDGLEVESLNASLLYEPWKIKTKSGVPYKVFTPFWNALRDLGSPTAPQPAPGRLHAAPTLDSDALEDWALLPNKPDWAGGLREHWQPGETGAQDQIEAFLHEGLAGYRKERDRPDLLGTSSLSPHLAFGEISPRQIWHWTLDAVRGGKLRAKESDAFDFLRQLAWRDFSYHLLFHWPDFPEKPWKEAFANFPWRDDDAGFRAWCRGETGYPSVDAAMRQLWSTGWMHNRMRMVAASFLVKHLLIPWQKGEAWFWDTLVDADLANNSASWQWVAGCGADAAPYFRIFNPVTQGERFDPNGDYVRRWVPEIAGLPDKYLQKPWEAPQEHLRDADIILGETYPRPIVDHKAARARALAAYDRVKG